MKRPIRYFLSGRDIYFQIKKNKAGEYYFLIKSTNGRCLASSEGYSTKNKLLHTLGIFTVGYSKLEANYIIIRDESLDIDHYPCWYALDSVGNRYAIVFYGESKWNKAYIDGRLHRGAFSTAVKRCIDKIKDGYFYTFKATRRG